MRLADPTRSKVVLIGAAHFDDPALHDLPAVRNNVLDLQRILVDPTLGGLSEESCHAFVNPRNRDLVHIGEIAKQAEDVLFLYYSGHGLIGENNGLLLALSDTSVNHRQLSAVTEQHLNSIFKHTPAAVRVLVVDCCYSGRLNLQFMSGPAEMVNVEGAYKLTSSTREQVSLARAGERHTVFTGALISLLEQGIPGGEPLISMDTIYRRMLAALRKENLPEPTQVNSETASSLALVRNVAFAGRHSQPAEQPVSVLGRRVRDRAADLTVRVDALDALVAHGEEATREVASLAGDASLPILVRLRLIHELAGLPGGQDVAEFVLSSLVEDGDGAAALQRMTGYLGLLTDDQRFRRAMARSWHIPEQIDDHDLWGIVMVGMMSAVGLTFGQVQDAARELRALRRPAQADAVLRGMLAQRQIDLHAEAEIRGLLDSR